MKHSSQGSHLQIKQLSVGQMQQIHVTSLNPLWNLRGGIVDPQAKFPIASTPNEMSGLKCWKCRHTFTQENTLQDVQAALLKWRDGGMVL